MANPVNWPAGVPSCIMPLSAQGGFRDNRLSFDTDSKMNPIERPSSSWAPEVYSIEMTPMSLSQFEEFQRWYAQDLRFGALPFAWRHPITRKAGAWKIVKGDPPYRVTKRGLTPIGSDSRRVGVVFTVMSCPLPLTDEQAIIAEFGSLDPFPYWEDRLHVITNEDYPPALDLPPIP